MSTKTAIEWTDMTWNPVIGCSPVSPGCLNCYAATMANRLQANPKQPEYHPLRRDAAGADVTTLPGMWDDSDRTIRIAEIHNGRAVFTGEVRWQSERLADPLRWKKPRRVFVNSMSDLFWGTDADLAFARKHGVPDPQPVPLDFIASVFAVMGLATWHTFQVLTKRPERMAAVLSDPAFADAVENAQQDFSEEADESAQRFGLVDVHARVKGDWRSLDHASLPLANVWLGTSIEDQATADERIPHLLRCPAAVRFLSAEPLLRAVSINPTWFRPDFVNDFHGKRGDGIHWVIVGGESGPNARPMHPDWARSIRDQCVAAGVPFFFKQWGEWSPFYDRDVDDPDWRRIPEERDDKVTRINLAGGRGFHGERVVYLKRVGKKAAGRLLDGREWNEFPGGAR